MSVTTKTRPISLLFRPGTPRNVLKEVQHRYASFLLDDQDEAVDFEQTSLYKKINASMTPGLWVKHLREAQGISQASLGKLLGDIKASRISDWENGHRTISKDVAKSLSNIFSVSADRFI